MDNPPTSAFERAGLTITEADREYAQAMYPDVNDAYREMLFASDFPEASDGCTVYEPDGWCPCGRPSPYLALGIV